MILGLSFLCWWVGFVVLVGVGTILGDRSRDFSEEKSLLIVVACGGAWKLLCLDQ